MCNSLDTDVECSDSYEGLLKYQVCYRETLKCGNEQVFIVNENLQTVTSDFFSDPAVCVYKLKTYESNDQIIQNVTFTLVRKAEATLIYKKLGQTSYTEETIELADRENYTFSVKRRDLSDKTLYIVVKATSSNDSKIEFETIKSDIPEVVPDYSNLARVAMWVLIGSLILIFMIKVLEWLEVYLKNRDFLVNDNDKFMKRLGIDFRKDRERLENLASITRKNFSNDCLTNRSLFVFRKGGDNS